ncbi:hypothetical protein [Nonomuraea sp. NEAU-A123]|uniref:hypothetical protein n=1 Tax=Nonomuraea sp. NEAU-A123 TaxID=2839649 RepID=UPI001BE410C6|nr:hypothetical protein [Nonomuraea sp. NEAU-A123]MBT2232389.1 hypothetical protein [Nonomuraea sp. NEAU-A123]
MSTEAVGVIPTIEADTDPPATATDWANGRNVLFSAGGEVILRAALAGVTPFTPVTVSITEVDANGHPFIGGARMTVHNVRAFEGGVDTRVSIEFNGALRVRLSYLWS